MYIKFSCYIFWCSWCRILCTFLALLISAKLYLSILVWCSLDIFSYFSLLSLVFLHFNYFNFSWIVSFLNLSCLLVFEIFWNFTCTNCLYALHFPMYGPHRKVASSKLITSNALYSTLFTEQTLISLYDTILKLFLNLQNQLKLYCLSSFIISISKPIVCIFISACYSYLFAVIRNKSYIVTEYSHVTNYHSPIDQTAPSITWTNQNAPLSISSHTYTHHSLNLCIIICPKRAGRLLKLYCSIFVLYVVNVLFVCLVTRYFVVVYY